jgi:hypothetical protein
MIIFTLEAFFISSVLNFTFKRNYFSDNNNNNNNKILIPNAYDKKLFQCNSYGSESLYCWQQK